METNPSPVAPSRVYMPTETPRKPEEESIPQSTPIKKTAALQVPYTSNHVYYDPGLAHLAAEMQGKYEEISVESLLDMLDDAPGMPVPNYTSLKPVAELESERDMYDPFVCGSCN